jgi:protein PhnA
MMPDIHFLRPDRAGHSPAAGRLASRGQRRMAARRRGRGTRQTRKQGAVIRSIRRTDDAGEIDCRHEAFKGLVPRTEFVRKR